MFIRYYHLNFHLRLPWLWVKVKLIKIKVAVVPNKPFAQNKVVLNVVPEPLQSAVIIIMKKGYVCKKWMLPFPSCLQADSMKLWYEIGVNYLQDAPVLCLVILVITMQRYYAFIDFKDIMYPCDIKSKHMFLHRYWCYVSFLEFL